MNKGWYKSYSYLFKPLYNYQEDCRTNYYDNDTTVPFILNEDITSMSVV